MQDRTAERRLARRPEWVVDQCAPAGTEVRRIAAQVPDVVVASDDPEPRLALVDRIVGPEPRQDLEKVRPGEEGRVRGSIFSIGSVRWSAATSRAYCAAPQEFRSSPTGCRRPPVPAKTQSATRESRDQHSANLEHPVSPSGAHGTTPPGASPYPAAAEHAPLSGLDQFLVPQFALPRARDVDAGRAGLRASLVHV